MYRILQHSRVPTLVLWLAFFALAGCARQSTATLAPPRGDSIPESSVYPPERIEALKEHLFTIAQDELRSSMFPVSAEGMSLLRSRIEYGVQKMAHERAIPERIPEAEANVRAFARAMASRPEVAPSMGDTVASAGGISERSFAAAFWGICPIYPFCW